MISFCVSEKASSLHDGFHRSSQSRHKSNCAMPMYQSVAQPVCSTANERTTWYPLCRVFSTFFAFDRTDVSEHDLCEL